MKGVVFDGPYRFTPKEMPNYKLGKKDILVKVKAVGVCGSDMHRFKGELPFPEGEVMGHEYSGEVFEVGSDVKNFKPGDKIVPYPITTCNNCEMCSKGFRNLCNNGYFGDAAKALAEYVKLDTDKEEIYKLPDEVSFQEGAFVEPLAVALNSVKKAKPDILQNIVVLGVGPIGILITAVLTTYPVNVIAVDISDIRLDAAKKLGAYYTINAEKNNVKEKLSTLLGSKKFGIYHEGPNIDTVFEAAGAPNTLFQSLDIVKAKGKVVISAYVNPPITFNPNIIPQKEINIIGTFCYTEEFEEAIEFIASKKINFNSLISHEYPLEKTQEAFEKQADVKNSIKVLVKPT